MALFHAFLMFHSLVVLLIWVHEAAAAVAADVVGPITGTIKPSCPEKCGDISIPYPFGIGEGCYLDKAFNVTCNYALNPPMPKIGKLDVFNISIRDGQMGVKLSRALRCNNNGRLRIRVTSGDQFTFSDTRNKFIAIGCNTIAYLAGRTTASYGTGCMSMCDQIDDVINGSCTGLGCCMTSIPKGLVSYGVNVGYINNSASREKELSFNPCSYAFLAEESWYKFSSSDLKDFHNGQKLLVPAVLEWTVGKVTCEEAQRNSTSYACGDHTHCYNPGNAPGYRCNCSSGYQGNPYLKHGCQDVDECNKSLYPKNPCDGSLKICMNTEGSFQCTCPPGYEETNTKDCVKPDRVRLLNKIIIGIALGLFFLLVTGSWLYWGYRKRKLMKLKEKFFQQNGGMMLKQLLQGEEAVGSRTAKIFTAEELKKATNKYDESLILGRGGFGTVYKGTLVNGTVVAIKKSKVVDRSQIDQFVNEVLVLSQINHRNVVTLLGCCLETEVPLLVYEFITNGTLSEHLHERENQVSSSLSWDNRLRIAVEVAESLAYLHSAASVPIIHRDVKSTNILLDESYTAKVSDFGASRLVPIDQTELTTLVQGTLGYLDPEYFHTSLLTDKSDVYSFGVLLAELLTGKMALSFDRPEQERSLANYFISSMKENRLHQILDDSLVNDRSIDVHQLQQVGELIKRCLSVVGEKRPTMKEVAMVLDGLRRTSNHHPWVIRDTETNNHEEENVYLLGEGQLSDGFTDSISSGYDSMNNQVPSSLNFGR